MEVKEASMAQAKANLFLLGFFELGSKSARVFFSATATVTGSWVEAISVRN